MAPKTEKIRSIRQRAKTRHRVIEPDRTLAELDGLARLLRVSTKRAPKGGR